MPEPASLCPPRTAGKLRPSGPTAGVLLRNGGMAYTRRPSVPTGRGSLKKPEQGARPRPSPAGRGPSKRFCGNAPATPCLCPRPEGGSPPLRLIPAAAHPATCPLPNHLLPKIGNKIHRKKYDSSFHIYHPKQQIPHCQDNIFFIPYHIGTQKTVHSQDRMLTSYSENPFSIFKDVLFLYHFMSCTGHGYSVYREDNIVILMVII